MSATGAYAVGLYSIALFLSLLLHAWRDRITLAPLFAFEVIATFLIWQLTQVGWWGEWNGVAFNAPLLALLPGILLGIGLIYAIDGTRTARAYAMTLAAACVASIAYEEFLRGLGGHMPMPSFFFFSLLPQLGMAMAVLASVLSVTILYEAAAKIVSSALAVALGVAGGMVVFLVVYSLLTYGPVIGWRNFRIEIGQYVIVSGPLLLLVLIYGRRVARQDQFVPARRLSEAFALWRSSDQAYEEVRQDFLQARARIGALTALTERLQMERQLRDYQTQHSPLAVLDLGTKGNVRDYNPAAQRLFARLTRGIALEDLLPGFAGFLARGADLSGVFEHRGEAGTRQIQITVMPIRLQQRLEGYSLLAEDVTARERAKFKQQVAERVKGIQMTTKVIGHDFSNMMLAIEGNLGRLRDALPPALREGLEDNLTAIANAANRGREMLRQLGTQQPFQMPEPRTQELWPLVAEAIRLQQAAALAAGIRFSPRIQPEIYAEIDATQIMRVLINLIGNAIRATPPGGSITLTLGLDGNGAVISVADTGRGMTPDQLAVAFEPGFSSKTGGQGGLGLAISYLIVEAHGGRLGLDSVVGQGTTARVWLPCADPARAEAPSLTVLVAVTDEPRRAAVLEVLAPVALDLTEVTERDELDAILEEDPRPWQLAVFDPPLAAAGSHSSLDAVCRMVVRDGEVTLDWCATCPKRTAEDLRMEISLAMSRLE